MKNIAIHCETQKQFDEVLKVFKENGWVWNDETDPLSKEDFWEIHQERTCLHFKNYFGISNLNSLSKKDFWEIISYRDWSKLEYGIHFTEIRCDNKKEMEKMIDKYLKEHYTCCNYTGNEKHFYSFMIIE